MADSSERFGKVAVLMGGLSAEREVSLKSGQAVLQGLLRQGINAHAVDVDADVMATLMSGGFDRAFNILHGRFGEDGIMQGALEAIGLPYTGSGVSGSALAMDKVRSKQIWQAMGLPTADFCLVESETDFDVAIKRLGLPLFLKAAREGSSVGVVKVSSADQFADAWQQAAVSGDSVLAEKFITGDELTVAILNGRTLPIIRLEASNEFYDYEAKYVSNETQYHCPAGLEPALERDIEDLALRAFRALGCSGWGRVDVMLDDQRQPLLLEVNTIPGMTDHSLVPMAARQAGLSFDELLIKILEGSL